MYTLVFCEKFLDDYVSEEAKPEPSYQHSGSHAFTSGSGLRDESSRVSDVLFLL